MRTVTLLNVVFIQVYDVSKGASYYGPGGGYAFFAGKDGSRAFVSGQFDAEGLVEDVSGLPTADYLGLQVSPYLVLCSVAHTEPRGPYAQTGFRWLQTVQTGSTFLADQ